MTNDTNVPTAELVSSEVSGYIGPDGTFVYGTPPAETISDGDGSVYVQTDEDAIEG